MCTTRVQISVIVHLMAKLSESSRTKPRTVRKQPTSTGQRVGYVRVSALDQNEIRQLDGRELDKVFTDHAHSVSRF